jgi:hypothetical protein
MFRSPYLAIVSVLTKANIYIISILLCYSDTIMDVAFINNGMMAPKLTFLEFVKVTRLSKVKEFWYEF